MKSRCFSAVLLLTAGLLLVSASSPARAEANINFVLGAKHLDGGDWPGAEEQGEFGVQTTFGPPGWPVSFAVDAIASGAHNNFFLIDPDPLSFEFLQTTFELDVGVRKIWKSGKARPFVGGGLAIIGAGREFLIGPVSVSESQAEPGLWVDGGVFWRLGKKFNIGFEARFSRAEVTIAGQEFQAGGTHVGLLLGWGWGGGS